MPELTVANVRALDRRLIAATSLAMRRTVTAVALAGEKQAKVNVSSGSHRKGTPTPASKGSGPAVVTGNLRRNITHEAARLMGTVWVSRVGVAGAASYGRFVEDLGYVFMKPTAEFLRTVVIPAATRSEFGRMRLR